MRPSVFARIATAPQTGLWTRPYLGLWICQALNGLLSGPLIALFPVYIEQGLGLDASLASWLRAAFVALGGLMALPAGALCVSLGPRRAYLLSFTGLTAVSLIFVFRQPLALWALAVYTGLGFGLGSVAGQTYLLCSVPRTALGMATAGYFMANTAGAALGNLWGGRLADQLGYAALGWGTAAAALLLQLAAWRWLPGVIPPDRAGGETAGGYRQLARRPDVWVLLGLRFFPTAYWGAVTFLLPLLIFDVTRTNRAVGDFQALSLVMSAVGQALSGRLCDRGRRAAVMLTAAAGIACSAAGLLLAHRSLAGIYVVGSGGAVAAWMLSTTMPGVVRDLSGKAEERSRLLGATHLAWSAGFLYGTLVAGAGRPQPVGVLGNATAWATLALALVVALLPFLRRGPGAAMDHTAGEPESARTGE